MARLTSPAKVVVLIVEDEPIVRMLAADWIEEAGFKVLEAGNADEAVRILDRARTCGLSYGHRHAGLYGRARASGRCSRALAAD